MKIASYFLPLLCASVTCLARETAYQALRTVGKERGQEVLNRVIQVQGRSGNPQPVSWKVILDDQAARGGVRELEVIDGKIAAERTPVGAFTGAGATMDFQKLNLDSEGAFKIAVKEASKAHAGFDEIDYTLRSGEEGRPPVWVLQLMDGAHQVVGTMNIAADTGAIVRSDLYGKGSGPVVKDIPEPETDRVVVHDEERTTTTTSDDDEYVDDGHGGRLRVGHRINKALHEAGASLEQFFTGRRTIDRKYRDEDQ